jgi:hypothetical protein
MIETRQMRELVEAYAALIANRKIHRPLRDDFDSPESYSLALYRWSMERQSAVDRYRAAWIIYIKSVLN